MDPFASSRVRFEVRVESEPRYEVMVAPGALRELGRLHVEHFGGARPIVLSDRQVDSVHGAQLRAAFAAAGLTPDRLLVEPGEPSKSLDAFTRLLHELTRIGADRRCVLYNFGGGVVSDLGGFVASAYMRGVRYVNVATSLIGQLDASVGGKVAVNTAAAKNLIGAFHHPALVVSDPLLLATLGARDFRSGIAEAIKVAVIASPGLFDFLRQSRAAILARDPASLTELVGTAAQLKMEIVARDPYERDLRRPLNFGHTIGHAFESELGYRGLRHGEAVAVGMAIATALAMRRRLIAGGDAAAIFELLREYGLTGLVDDFPAARLAERLRCVRLIRGGALHFVLPREIGRVEICDDVDIDDLERAFHGARAIAAAGAKDHADTAR